MREREDASRTRAAGNRDEVEGVVANTMKLFRNGAVGCIDWLGLSRWYIRAGDDLSLSLWHSPTALNTLKFNSRKASTVLRELLAPRHIVLHLTWHVVG